MFQINPDIIVSFVAILTALFGGFSGVWVLRGWFASQFSKFYDRMEKMESNILEKLEYHEKHDDQRFAAVDNRLWEIKMEMLRTKILDQELSESRSPRTKETV